jgi:N-ethylmaleimide reductase
MDRSNEAGHWRERIILFAYVADALNRFGLAYLHVPRAKRNVVVAEGQAPVAAQCLRQIFKGTIVAAGGRGHRGEG